MKNWNKIATGLVCGIIAFTSTNALAASDKSKLVERLQVFHDELEDALGTDQVAQPMLAQVAQGDGGWQMVAHQLGGRLREEDVTAVPSRQQAGHAVHRRSEVVSVPLVRRARVQRHPHAEGTRT